MDADPNEACFPGWVPRVWATGISKFESTPMAREVFMNPATLSDGCSQNQKVFLALQWGLEKFLGRAGLGIRLSYIILFGPGN